MIFAIAVAGYGIVAVLMALLWSRVPPQQFFTEAAFGLAWPVTLTCMLVAAFVAAVVRANRDQNGEFAGLAKDLKWANQWKENHGKS